MGGVTYNDMKVSGKDAAMAISCYCPRRTEENHENSPSGHLKILKEIA